MGIVLMVHQPLKSPLRQTLEAYPGLTPALSSTPRSCQILGNTVDVIDLSKKRTVLADDMVAQAGMIQVLVMVWGLFCTCRR